MKFLRKMLYLDSIKSSDVFHAVKVITFILGLVWGVVATIIGFIVSWFPIMNPLSMMGWGCILVFLAIRAWEVADEEKNSSV